MIAHAGDATRTHEALVVERRVPATRARETQPTPEFARVRHCCASWA